jgi:hypothetical protein
MVAPSATPARVRPRYLRIAAAGSSVLVTLVALAGALGVLPTGGSAMAGSPAQAAVPQVPASIARDPVPATRTPEPSRSRPVSSEALPGRSGQGRRIVFAIGAQRVWLVSAKDRVRRSYLVSGSLTDNLQPGSYAVYSKSRDAIGVDDSGTMKFMVRFAHGEHAAIGFHDIPIKDGHRIQTFGELGTPQSHGCIRQRRADAKALWDFAPVGTRVVVVA